KPLLVRPVTPRFLTAGDVAEVAAVVQNNTDSDLEVLVRLDAQGVEVLVEYPLAQTINLPAHGRARTVWQVNVPRYGADAALLTFTAEGGGYRDAARPNVGREIDHALPVYRYESPQVYSTSGQLTSAGTRVESIVIPPEAGPDSVLTLRLDPTLAAGMLEGLSYLEHFPHECNEQLVSRFLPNVVSYLALKELGYDDNELEIKLWLLISEALDKLYSRQQLTGGWGWWSENNDFQVSAYVAFGMLQAQRTGFTVDWDVLDAAVAYLVRTLDQELATEKRTSVQAFAFYVLSEGGYGLPSGAAEILYASREQIGITGKAFLAMGLGLLDAEDPRIQTLLDELRADVEMTSTGAHWEGETGIYWQTWTRTTAVVLDAFSRLAPDDPLVSQTVRWLMIARKADRWETTQETVWAVIGLTDALVATGELRADYAWGVALNMEVQDEGQVTPELLREPVVISTSVRDLLREWPNALEISRGEGEGVLYYSADVTLYLPVEQLKAESRGISVERQYCLYTPAAQAATVPGEDYLPCVPVTSAKPGDLIEVRLTLTLPRMRNYLILEDAYPAGMEPVDPSLKTESQLLEEPDAQDIGRQTHWWQSTFTHSELRDERAVFYAPQLSAGTYQARYLLRAGFPGVYNVLPATASEMYFPDVSGRSDSAVFVIEP
ncbi:MAG: alpha-2-macroglobulin, partial [Anaerolineae bacterium]|nr:alpha-2-macroglobulin [Anaerolineae bacterium]